MLTLLVALLLQTGDGFADNFALQRNGICYRHMEFYDSPAIVETLRVVDRNTMNGNGRLDRDLVVRIVDADWAARGTEASIALPRVPADIPLNVVAGRRYLLVAAKAQDGKLRIAVGDWDRASVTYEYPARTSEERVGLAMFETLADRLPREGGPDVRMGLALADCFVPATGDRLNELCHFWLSSRTPGTKRAFHETDKFYTENSVVTEKLLQIAPTKRLTERALMYQMLIQLRILGTEGLLIQTLYACLQDPNVFQRGFYIPTMSLGPNPPTFETNMPDSNQCVDQLLAARNIVLRNVLIKESVPPPSIEQQRKFARFLDDDDPEVRANAVNDMALWHLKKDKMVKGVRNKQTNVVTYPDLDEKVAWWKQYWREH